MAVIGDGALSSGVVLEAMNHAGGLKKNMVVILNDNKMSICPRVGGLAESLDRLRMANFYTGLKIEVQKMLDRMPVIGDSMERFIGQVKDAVKAGLLGGMIFEDLGFRYIGPVDGHNVRQLQKYLAMVRQVPGAGVVARGDREGARLSARGRGPTTFHAPEPFAAEERLGGVGQGRVRASRTPRVVRDAVRAQYDPIRRWSPSPPPCAKARCWSPSATNS